LTLPVREGRDRLVTDQAGALEWDQA
jgi:hypothetical protein